MYSSTDYDKCHNVIEKYFLGKSIDKGEKSLMMKNERNFEAESKKVTTEQQNHESSIQKSSFSSRSIFAV